MHVQKYGMKLKYKKSLLDFIMEKHGFNAILYNVVTTILDCT